jgi:hypothetical protein
VDQAPADLSGIGGSIDLCQADSFRRRIPWGITSPRDRAAGFCFGLGGRSCPETGPAQASFLTAGKYGEVLSVLSINSQHKSWIRDIYGRVSIFDGRLKGVFNAALKRVPIVGARPFLVDSYCAKEWGMVVNTCQHWLK